MSEFKSLAKRYVSLSFRRPWLVLGVLIAVTVGSAIFGRPRVTTDLADLLPDHAPAVMALEEARARRVGGNEFYTIAVESPDPVATATFMRDIAERVNGWEETQFVQVEQDRTFFREHALLYLPQADLLNVKQNIQRIIRRELAQENPLFVDLSEDGDGGAAQASDNPLDWINPLTLRELGISEAEADSIFPFVEPEAPDEGGGAETLNGAAEDGVEGASEGPTTTFRRAELPEEFRDYQLSPSGTVGVVLARLNSSSTDVKQASELFDRGKAAIEELDPSSYHPSMQAAVVGAYRDFLEVRRIVRDVATATSVSVVLVVLLLMLFFRNVRSVVVVTVPLLVGVIWSVFAVKMAFGELNTLTAFIFSMLIGIGIDFGIHFYQRALREFSIGETWERAVYVSITRTGQALLTASVTTIVSLLVLLVASFSGFREFGVACAVGVALCLVSTVLVAPPLIAALERVRPSRRHARFSRSAARKEPANLRRWVRISAVVVLALAAYGLFSVRNTSFEYDFRNLRGPSTGSGISYGSAVGDNRSSAPSVMLGTSREQMREVHGILRERLERGDDPFLEGYVTIETFLPTEEEQEARLALIDEIYEVLDRRAVRNMEGRNGELVDTMLDLTDVDAFAFDDLPDYVRDQLLEQGGDYGKLGLIYTDVSWWNVLEVRTLQKQYSTVETSQGEVAIASSGYILDNVVRYVQADGPRLAMGIALALIIVLLLDLKSIRGALVCLITLFSGVCLTIAVMATIDLKLGLYNMVVLPTILGVGVDGAIHLYHRYLEEGRDGLWTTLQTTGTAIVASSLTTAAGFAGMMLTAHKGIETIGTLAIAGVLCSLVAVLGLLPGLISFLGERGGANPFATAAWDSVPDELVESEASSEQR